MADSLDARTIAATWTLALLLGAGVSCHGTPLSQRPQECTPPLHVPADAPGIPVLGTWLELGEPINVLAARWNMAERRSREGRAHICEVNGDRVAVGGFAGGATTASLAVAAGTWQGSERRLEAYWGRAVSSKESSPRSGCQTTANIWRRSGVSLRVDHAFCSGSTRELVTARLE